MFTGNKDYFGHLSHHSPHISYLVNEPTIHAPKPLISSSSQTTETTETTGTGTGTTKLINVATSWKSSGGKLGNLVPIHNFNSKTSSSGIYLDRAIQTTPEPVLAHAPIPVPEPTPEPELGSGPDPEPSIEPQPQLDLDSESEPSVSFPFSPNTTKLPPDVRRTQDLVNQYFKNIDETKHVLFQSPSLPTLPEDVWTDILANRYVDLGRIHFAYKPNAYPISTCLQWQDAFTAYKTGVCIAFPHRKEEFRTWVDNVTMLFKIHTAVGHHRVVRAERMQRQAIFDSRTRTLDDDSSVKELFSALSTSLVAPLVPHEPSKPATQQIKCEPAAPTPTSESISITDAPVIKLGRSLGVCSKWNWGRCSFGDACRLRHVCGICQSERHMGKDCDVPKRRKARRSLT